MPFIRLTRAAGDTLIVLNTDHIAQVEVNPGSYDTVVTMADGEQIYVDENLPTVLAMLPGAAPKPVEPAGVPLTNLQCTFIAAALHQLAYCATRDLKFDPDAQNLLAPIARRWDAAGCRQLAYDLQAHSIETKGAVT